MVGVDSQNKKCLCFKVSYEMGEKTPGIWIFSLIIFFAWYFFTEAFTRLPQRNLPRPCNLSKHIVEEARYFSFGYLNMFLDDEKNFRRNKTGHFSWSYFLKQHTETIGMAMGFNSLDIVSILKFDHWIKTQGSSEIK